MVSFSVISDSFVYLFVIQRQVRQSTSAFRTPAMQTLPRPHLIRRPPRSSSPPPTERLGLKLPRTLIGTLWPGSGPQVCKLKHDSINLVMNILVFHLKFHSKCYIIAFSVYDIILPTKFCFYIRFRFLHRDYRVRMLRPLQP